MDDIHFFQNITKIAIMGGTFDPIHYGHLVSAETVRTEFGFDKILFIPSGNPPHKNARAISDGEKRYLMTSFAISSNDYFDISRIEIERKGITYTIDTIREIKKQYESADIFFITGADAVLEILTWHNVDELLKICSFIAISRPGYNSENLRKQTEYLKNEMDAKVSFLEVPALAISSTDIRNRVKSGRTIKYLLPESVERFIYKYSLYKD